MLGQSVLRLGAIACLYASYGIDLGLLGSGAPLALRAHGLSLADVGLVQIIYLPIGLGFLWAPMLDQWSVPRLPHRTGWIVAGQAGAAALLVALAFATALPVPLLLLLAAVVSAAMATMDLSADALVTQTTDARGRASAATAKLVGSSLGASVGVALATMFAAELPLPRALVVAAIATVLLTLPIFGFGEQPRAQIMRDGHGSAARQALGEPGARRRLAGRAGRLGAFFGTSLLLGTAPGLLLIDLHVPLATAGLVTGPLGMGLGTAATLLSGVILARTQIGAPRLIVSFAAGTICGAILLLVAAAGGFGPLAAVASLLTMVSSSGLGVPVFATLYRWSEGARAATYYAVLFGAAFLVSFPARLGTPALAGLIGWPAFFAVATPAFALSVALLVKGMATPALASSPRLAPVEPQVAA